MTAEELETILNSPVAATAGQRRALYKLGLARSFVARHVKTMAQASAAINYTAGIYDVLRQADLKAQQGS